MVNSLAKSYPSKLAFNVCVYLEVGVAKLLTLFLIKLTTWQGLRELHGFCLGHLNAGIWSVKSYSKN